MYLALNKYYCCFILELIIFASDGGRKKNNFRELEGSMRSHVSSLWHIGPEALEMSCPPLSPFLYLSSEGLSDA